MKRIIKILMTPQKNIFLMLMFLVIPVQSFAGNELYIKKIRPDLTIADGQYEYQCNQRTDLVLLDGFERNPIPVDSYGYIKQYDPIISTSVLCKEEMEGISTPKIEYINFIADPPAEPYNSNGVPLQVYNVKAYCQLDDNGHIFIKKAAEVILLCQDAAADKK